MRVSLWLRSILVTLLLIAMCCSGRTISAATALGTDTSTLQLVGSLGGSATHLQVVGTRAFVGGPDSLRIVDVSNPASPAVISSYGSDVEDVQVVGPLAYLAGSNGLQILSVADPAHPALRGSYDLPPIGQISSQRASRVQVVGEYAYVIFDDIISAIPPYRSDLAIVDVRDPAHPALLSRYDLGPSFNDLAVHDGYVYVGGATDTGGTARIFNAYLSILDVHDPAAPTQIGRYQNDVIFIPTGSGGFALVGDLVYLGMGNGPALYTLDVHDRAHPARIGSLAINPSDLRVAGQFAYVADVNAGLTVVDIRDPAVPVQRAAYGPLGYPTGVDVAGDLVFIASDTGLRIVRFVPRTSALIPAGGAAMAATVGRVGYQFPAGAFSGTALVTHTLRLADDLPPAPAHIHIGPAFEITASYSATGQLAPPALPMTITVGYTDLERGAVVADTPALFYWDGSAWVKEPSSLLDQPARAVTATSKRLGLWALMGDAKRELLPMLRR